MLFIFKIYFNKNGFNIFKFCKFLFMIFKSFIKGGYKEIKSVLVIYKNLYSPKKQNKQSISDVFVYISTHLFSFLLKSTKIKTISFNNIDYTVNVIIPIYNGIEHLKKLIPYLFENTIINHKFIFIDDCSPDNNVKKYLNDITSSRNDCFLIFNEKNIGFPATINKAATYCNNNFVILNTDTCVPKGWLERIISPLNDKTIASVTPYSNAATICSFPFNCNDEENKKFLETFDFNTIDSACASVDQHLINTEIPCGVGFCMAISYAAWKEIGEFDSKTFGPGYGEEVDWCLRAKEKGYRHVLMPNLFVQHDHGGSFSKEVKTTQLKNSAKLISKKYTNFDTSVQEYIKKPEAYMCREKILLNLLLQKSYTLYITHSVGGGAEKYMVNRIFKDDTHAIILRCAPGTTNYDVTFFLHGLALNFNNFDLSLLQNNVFSIEKVVINELVTWPLVINGDIFSEWIKKLVANLSAKLEILFHDYYPICPNFKLLNSNFVYCNVPNLATCENCTRDGYSEYLTQSFVKIDIKDWRLYWSDLLYTADDVLLFSNASLEIIKKAYNIDRINYRICPHTLYASFTCSYIRGNIDGPIHVAIVGSIDVGKGANIISDFSKLLYEFDKNAKIILFGTYNGKPQHNLRCVGPFNSPDELPILLNKYKITEAFFTSIWPETFSYVTSELIALGVPLMGFNIGAQGEKIRCYSRGIVIDSITAKDALKALMTLHSKRFD